MKSKRGFRLFRPAAWSFAVKAAVILSLALALVIFLLVLIVGRVIHELGGEAITRAGQDAEGALATIDLLARRVNAWLAIGALVATGAFMLFSRPLIGRLGRLVETARLIGGEELDVTVPKLGEDEVGELADLLRGLARRLAEPISRLQVATQFMRATQGMLDVHQMLQSVADLIHSEMDMEQVRVYLVEAGGQAATLQATAGDLAEGLRRQQSRILLDGTNVIGEAVQHLSCQVRSGAGTLLGSVSELAAPLRVGDEVLGVLYSSSQRPDAFEPEDINLMELVAEQVSLSVQNVRLFEQRESDMKYIEALNRRLSREGWLDYVGEEGQLRYTLSNQGDRREWPESLTKAAESGDLVAEPVSGDGQALLAVPVSLRGEVIGTLGIEKPTGHEWSDEEVLLVQAVAERIALIAEGLRLLEETDALARREQLVNQITSKIVGSTDIGEILHVTARELGKVLRSPRTSVQLLGEQQDE